MFKKDYDTIVDLLSDSMKVSERHTPRIPAKKETAFIHSNRDLKTVADEMLPQPNVMYFVPTKVPT